MAAPPPDTVAGGSPTWLYRYALHLPAEIEPQDFQSGAIAVTARYFAIKPPSIERKVSAHCLSKQIDYGFGLRVFGLRNLRL